MMGAGLVENGRISSRSSRWQRRSREPTTDGLVEAMHAPMPSQIVRGEAGGLAGYALARARAA